MIILGLFVLACLVIVGTIAEIFDLSSSVSGPLFIWFTTFAVCSLFVYMAAFPQ